MAKTEPDAPKVGRPLGSNTRSPELDERLLNWIAEGRTLRAFCRQENAPAWRTVYHWLEDDPEFLARFARARDMGHDAISEETLEIADTPVEGVEKVIKGDKVAEERRGDMLGHRKLQIETRLKLLAKWNPKKYGDRPPQNPDDPGDGQGRTVRIENDSQWPNR